MPTALITGASSGIGLELARVFAREGYDLVLIARDQKRLEGIAQELKSVQVRVLATDLSRPEAPAEVFTAVPKVNVLVNNAGFGVFGKFAETALVDELNMMQLNMATLVALTKLYLPGMVAAKNGRICNVASTAAFQPGPLMAIYYATKAFVLHFSEAIGNELEGTGVTVTALCPGPTASGFQEQAKMEDSGLVKGKKIMDARTVAEAGYKGIMAGKRIVIPGLMNRVIAQSVGLMPRSLITTVVRKMQEKVE
ncbi:MAG: SDR family oxidoreductase [Acidobacteriota bacterium]|nr:SDR family oxidoreductase [Acidobacteriota bacterium]